MIFRGFFGLRPQNDVLFFEGILRFAQDDVLFFHVILREFTTEESNRILRGFFAFGSE